MHLFRFGASQASSLGARARPSCSFNHDSALLVAKVTQLNPHLGCREAEFLSPFDEHGCRLVDQIFQSECGKILHALNPIEVDMVHLRPTAVLVNQRERRAGDFLFAGHAQAGNDAFRH